MKFKKYTSLALSAALSASVVCLVPSEVNAATDDMLVGIGRHETAVKISQKGFKSAKNAVIVNDSAIADALAATPFAESIDAPILLTGKKGLNKSTEKELIRLGVKNVYLIGGEAVLPMGIEYELKAKKLNVERIKGDTREKTAVEIGKKIAEKAPVKEIAVVNGTKGLADAVSIAAVAAEKDMAIILSNPKTGISASEEFIKDNKVESSYIIGGNAVVSSEIENALPSPERISGSNRNATNAKVINRFYKSKSLKNLYIAKNGSNGENQLVDALAVGVLAAKNNSPVMIVSNGLSKEQKAVLKDKSVKTITQVGGNGNEKAYEEAFGIVAGYEENENKIQDYYIGKWYGKEEADVYTISADNINGFPYRVIDNEGADCVVEMHTDNGVERLRLRMTEIGIVIEKYNETTTEYKEIFSGVSDPKLADIEK